MNFWPSTCYRQLRPLKRVCHLNPETLPENTDPGYEFEYIDIGNVTLAGGVVAREHMRFADSPSRARKPLRAGDVIVSTVRTYLKAVAGIGPEADRWVASTGFAVLRPGPKTYSRYLFRVVQSNPFVESVVASSTGVSYPAINPSTLGDLPVPLPDHKTQKTIADFLDRETGRIDQLIEKKERLKELVTTRFDAQVSQAVTSGLGNQANGFVDSGIDYLGAVPCHWSVERTGWRYSIQLGKMLDAAKQTGKHLTQYLRVADVQWDWVNIDGLPNMDFSTSDRLKYSLKDGDLLVNEGGSYVGRSAIWLGQRQDCCYQKALHRLRPRLPKRDTTEFFLWVMWFATKRGVFVANGNQTTIDHLTAESLRRYRFAFPPLDEQQAIANRLRRERKKSLDLANKINNSIEKLREFRSALITAAVTGQIDVNTWSRRGSTDRRLDEIAEEMRA